MVDLYRRSIDVLTQLQHYTVSMQHCSLHSWEAYVTILYLVPHSSHPFRCNRATSMVPPRCHNALVQHYSKILPCSMVLICYK